MSRPLLETMRPRSIGYSPGVEALTLVVLLVVRKVEC